MYWLLNKLYKNEFEDLYIVWRRYDVFILNFRLDRFLERFESAIYDFSFPMIINIFGWIVTCFSWLKLLKAKS